MEKKSFAMLENIHRCRLGDDNQQGKEINNIMSNIQVDWSRATEEWTWDNPI